MYENIQKDIYKVFGSSAWTSLGYKAYPSNYDGKIDSKKSFVRISILPSRGDLSSHGYTKRLRGALIISIFVKSGNGDKELFEIADKLDSLFESKTLINGTQFGPSMLNTIGLDATDNTYYRGDYMINFTIYGE
jgi:hypothetical protein